MLRRPRPPGNPLRRQRCTGPQRTFTSTARPLFVRCRPVAHRMQTSQSHLVQERLQPVTVSLHTSHTRSGSFCRWRRCPLRHASIVSAVSAKLHTAVQPGRGQGGGGGRDGQCVRWRGVRAVHPVARTTGVHCGADGSACGGARGGRALHAHSVVSGVGGLAVVGRALSSSTSSHHAASALIRSAEIRKATPRPTAPPTPPSR